MRIVKDIVEPPTPHLDYGTEVHKAAEDYVCGDKSLDPKYAFIKPTLDALKALPGIKLCEYEMGDHAHLVDYKTGKSSQYADTKQLELLALLVFKHFPHVQSIKAGLVFVVAQDLVKASFVNNIQEDAWGRWLPEIQRLEAAMTNDVWNARPNFTCRKFCHVKDCEHNGKGQWR